MARGGTDIMDLVLIGGVGYLVYYAGKNGYLGEDLQRLFSGAGGGGGGGTTGMTSTEAYAAARSRLGALSPFWLTATDAQIRSEICANRTLFTGTGDDAKIRAAIGCPL